MKRYFVGFLVLLLLVPSGVAVAQTASDVSGGPFDHENLVENGVREEDAPPSVRMVGDPVRGAVSVRHKPASPLQNEWQWVEADQTVKVDRVQLYSTAFGDASGEYTLVVVQWDKQKRQVSGENGSAQVPVAANQNVQRISVTLNEGYDTTQVKLASSYDRTREVTAWLEKDGEPVDGVRWRFKHTSVATGQAVPIDSEGDALWYALRTSTLPGIAAIILGLSLAKIVLKQIGTPPRYGLGVWAILGGGGLLVTVGGLYYEVAAILAHFDLLIGVSLGIVAFGGGLRFHPPLEKVAFERQELTEALALRRADDDGDDDALATGTNPPAAGPGPGPKPDPLADGGAVTDSASGGVVEIPHDGYQDELYQDLPILPTVRVDGGERRVPVAGLKPAIARFFADAATLDLTSLRTRVKVRNGPVAEKVYLDPESDGIAHKPARLKRRMPVWHRVADKVDELATPTKWLYALLAGLALTLPGWGFVAGKALLNTPIAGAAVGTVLLAVESYGAHDGFVDFEPAPRHDLTANASLTVMQNEHADAKTLEEFEEIAWEERSRTALEAREVEARRDKSIVQLLNEKALGMDLGIVDRDDATNGDLDEPEDLLGGPDRQPARSDGGEDSGE